MGDYHTTYTGPEGETTQWDDIQRKLGNLPSKEPVWKPEKYAPAQEEVKDIQWLDGKENNELEELDDEFADDRFLEKYRQKRLEELRQASKTVKFGTIEEIRRNEFVQKVTNAGEGIYVVVLLYKDSSQDCGLMKLCLEELAKKYPSTKFVKIISTDCIPKYPDQNLPTILLYHDTKCLQHIVGLGPFGGKRITPELVALGLNMYGPVCKTGNEDEDRELLYGVMKSLMLGKEDGDKDDQDH